MQIRVTTEGLSDSAYVVREPPGAGRDLARFWWLWLVTGIAWIAAALVVLQFDGASVTTVGVIVGILFAVSSAQQFVMAALAESLRWLWAIFGVLFAAAAIICFINPEGTFVALADILGFLFLTVGVWWTIRAFLVRAAESTWWIDLVAGIMMLVMAFWTSGQFFIEKAYTLLVFAGIWALMHGITDIVGAFRVRNARTLP
ncbi:MAG TPA: DUF308 domain-containing protein [Solirubrobacteraceae bacterium]|nr:DUF308 domain-containing protein [Solirubrobacteraceae bacterium]